MKVDFYSGYYTYKKSKVKHQFHLFLKYDHFSGSGKDEFGEFEFDGKVKKSGCHRIVKKYKASDKKMIMTGINFWVVGKLA